jgi:hypothetical protein
MPTLAYAAREGTAMLAREEVCRAELCRAVEREEEVEEGGPHGNGEGTTGRERARWGKEKRRGGDIIKKI